MTVTEDAQFTAHPEPRPSRRLTVLIFLRKGYCLSHYMFPKEVYKAILKVT